MKKVLQLSALALLPVSTNLCASHLATEIAKTSITIDSLSIFETMVASGDLLEYIELVGGVDNASISFNDNGSVTMTVTQAR